MSQTLRKSYRLSNMSYNRVDMVDEGGSGDGGDSTSPRILIAKRREPQSVTKAMGTHKCNSCNTKMGKQYTQCKNCGSYNVSKILITVTKTVEPLNKAKKPSKQTPSRDNGDGTPGPGYTFEDEQLDQDDDANGQYVDEGDEMDDANADMEDAKLAKGLAGYFPVRVSKTQRTDNTAMSQNVDVDNDAHEARTEGSQRDSDIEALAEMNPEKKTKRKGYKSTTSSTSDSTMATMKRRVRKSVDPSFDHGDAGSQVVAENAQQMLREEGEPNSSDAMDNSRANGRPRIAKANTAANLAAVFPGPAQTRNKKTKGKVGIGAKQGLSIMQRGSRGIYSRPGQKGYKSFHPGTTSSSRSAVAPPGNPEDVAKRTYRVRKARPGQVDLETLTLGVQLAQNLAAVCKARNPAALTQLIEDFSDTTRAYADVWMGGQTIAKRSLRSALGEDIAGRVNQILKAVDPRYADPDSSKDDADYQMSDDGSAGKDRDEIERKGHKSSTHKPTTVPAGDTTGSVNKQMSKNGIKKSRQAEADEDFMYEGLHPDVIAKIKAADAIVERDTAARYEKMAGEFAGIPGFNVAVVAKGFRFLDEHGQAEVLEAQLTGYRAAKANLADSAVFKALGHPGAQSDNGDPMAAAYAYADSVVAKGANPPSREVLVAKYITEHPEDFYQVAKP